MNVDIKSKTENKVLDRKEVKAEVAFDGATPKRAELRQAISAKLGANPELVVLREVKNAYGTHSVLVVAHAYESKEVLMSTEPEYIRKRDSIGVEKKAEPKKEEAKEEKPKKEEAKEKKEEAKKEKEAPKEEEKKEEKKE